MALSKLWSVLLAYDGDVLVLRTTAVCEHSGHRNTVGCRVLKAPRQVFPRGRRVPRVRGEGDGMKEPKIVTVGTIWFHPIAGPSRPFIVRRIDGEVCWSDNLDDGAENMEFPTSFVSQCEQL